MTTLTSVLNYGALLTLSCCNAMLQVAGGSACNDQSGEAAWHSCAGDRQVRRAELHRPGRSLANPDLPRHRGPGTGGAVAQRGPR